MTVVWRALALRDLRKIYAHIAHHADPIHGYDTLAAIRTQANSLANFPHRGRAGEKPGTRFIIVTVRDITYRVTYRVRGQSVIILRVRDTRQQGA